MTATAIVKQLAGLPRLEAVRVIVAVLHEVTAGMSAEDLPGIVPIIKRVVPLRTRKPACFAPVWEYLETVKEYSTQKELRESLIKRFGKAGTPSKSSLNRYLLSNRGVEKCN